MQLLLMIIVQSHLLNDIMLFQFCDPPPFSVYNTKERIKETESIKTCLVSSTLENSGQACTSRRECSDQQKSEVLHIDVLTFKKAEIDPVPFAVVTNRVSLWQKGSAIRTHKYILIIIGLNLNQKCHCKCDQTQNNPYTMQA